MLAKHFIWQKAKLTFSRLLFISKKVREVREEIDLLLKHVDKMSNENIALKNKLAEYEPIVGQFEEWNKNPGKVLEYYYPNLCIEPLNFKLDSQGKLVKEEDNLFKELSREDRMAHLKDIDFIHRSPAFNREMDRFVKDIQKTKILNNQEDEGKLLGLFLLFIAGLRGRFRAISTELAIETKQKKEHIRTHPLGSMAK